MFGKKKILNYNIILKILFPFLIKISKNAPDSGDGDVGGDGEKFFIGKCCGNEIT